MFKANNAAFRQPQPGDDQLDFVTYEALWRLLQEWGSIAPGDITAREALKDTILVKISARVRVAGDSGTTIPDDTEVFMYEGVEVAWDSSTNQFEIVDEGMQFDGQQENYLRLLTPPPFADEPYNYGPILNDTVVVAFLVPEWAAYSDSSTEEGSTVWLEGKGSWHFFYLGPDPVVHPFKVSVDADNLLKVVVGYMRDFTAPSDYITIVNGTSAPVVITKNTAEDVNMTPGVEEGFVYYELQDLGGSSPTATLRFTETWPPTAVSPASENPYPILLASLRASIGGTNEIIEVRQEKFDSAVVVLGGGGVRYSITTVDGFRQFVNDKPIGGLGGNSINLYAGNDAGTGKGRGWKPGWEESDILNSVINPQEDGNDPNRGGMNQRQLRTKNNNNKQTVAFRHSNLPESDLDDKVIDYIWGITQATKDSLGSTDPLTADMLTRYLIEDCHHIYREGQSYVEDPYDPYEPTSGVKIQSLSGLSSSGTFFDDNLSQESQTLDDQGNNTAIYNTLGGLATSTNFVMSAMNTEGQLLEISIAQAGFNAVGNAILKDISEYDAPKNGNDDDIRLNLARFAFNTQIIFTVSLLDFPDKSDTISIAGHNGMSSTTEFVNLPENGIQKDVKVNLLQNGVNITRFDNLGEYRVKFPFTYKSDGSAVDVGGDPGTENILYITDTDLTWVNGEVTVSYTPTIPDLRLNDIIEVCPVLEWYQNANANPAQLGDTNFPMVCAESAITGNPYEITLAVEGVGNVVDTFSPEINNTTGVFDEPIPWEFEILKNGAPTTDYSNAGAKVRIYMYKLGDSDPLVGWADEFLTETTLAQPYIEYTIDASGGQTNNTDGQVGFIDKIQLEDYTTTTQYYLRYEVIE